MGQLIQISEERVCRSFSKINFYFGVRGGDSAITIEAYLCQEE